MLCSSFCKPRGAHLPHTQLPRPNPRQLETEAERQLNSAARGIMPRTWHAVTQPPSSYRLRASNPQQTAGNWGSLHPGYTRGATQVLLGQGHPGLISALRKPAAPLSPHQSAGSKGEGHMADLFMNVPISQVNAAECFKSSEKMG